MWPDHETETDLLGFQHLVDALTGIVSKTSLLPATIGIYGDWGSGKSSLLRQATSGIDSDEDTVVITFNGWLFEGYDDAKSALIQAVLGEIRSRRTFKAEAKRLFVSLVRRVNWFRAAATLGRKAAIYGTAFSVGGPAAMGVLAVNDGAHLADKARESLEGLNAEKLDELLNEDADSLQASIREFRKDFENLLDETKIKTLVVIIDDLDRCLPDTIIETLEAIKLFLFVPRSAFILGADERLVEYAVRRRFPELPGERVDVGRDYLEKLVQFPVRIPPLGRPEMETYIGLLFAELAGVPTTQISAAADWAFSADSIREGRAFDTGAADQLFSDVKPDVVSKLKEQLALAQRLAPTLAAQLSGNPRQCKRFLNTLMMRLQMAESRGLKLEQRVLAKLMLLEHFRSETFKRLAELQAQQGGKPSQLLAIESHRQREIIPSTATNKKADDSDSTAKPIPLPPLDAECQTWLKDGFVQEWLDLEPQLSHEDLRPYVFFSRDRIASLPGAAVRLSPAAQEILIQIAGDSEAVRTQALKKCSALSAADASAVFEEIAGRVRQEHDLTKDDSPLERLFDFVENRRELLSELVTLLRRIPEGELPIQVVPRLANFGDDADTGASATELIRSWAVGDSGSMVSHAASTHLDGKK